jgi:hypothetical protein
VGPIVQIQRWSSAAASLLQHQQTVGWVQSCYARIVNLRTPTGRLLTLQGQGRLQAPLALACAGECATLVPRLPAGALVVQHRSETHGVPAALRLVWAGAEVWDGRVRPVPALTAAALSSRTDLLTAWLVEHVPARGLAPLLTARHGQGLAPVCQRVSDAFMPLCTGGVALPDMLGIVSQVVGLGAGLTPSGDDLLVGLLAVLHVTGHLYTVLPPAQHPQFLQTISAGTVALSVEFLRCALAGDFAEPVACLVRSLFLPAPDEWPVHAASLAVVGHSSGIDAMVGMVLGCRLLVQHAGRD